MSDTNVNNDVEAFEALFKLDVRVESVGTPMGRCNPTNDGCSNSCTSVGCPRNG